MSKLGLRPGFGLGGRTQLLDVTILVKPFEEEGEEEEILGDAWSDSMSNGEEGDREELLSLLIWFVVNIFILKFDWNCRLVMDDLGFELIGTLL